MARSLRYRLEKQERTFVVCKRKTPFAPFQPMDITRHERTGETTVQLTTASQYDGMQVIAILKQGFAVFAIFDDIYYVNADGEPTKITGKYPNAK